MEKWMDLKGFESTHSISSHGVVMAKKSGRILKQTISNSGYYRCTVCFMGRIKNISVHRLVALSFIPNPENKPTVNHIDGVKINNKAENLEWATWSENTCHAIRLFGLVPHNIGIINSTNPKAVLQIN